jgi:putative sugar O-methyltransferase
MNKLWDVNQSMIDNYLQACNEFVENDNLFNVFKVDARYTPVLEHLTESDANLYFSEMKSKEILTKTLLDSVKENDTYGSPLLFNHSELGIISPTTVRYIKNSLDIVSYFGSELPFKNVLEIGGGYGGLCKVFSSFNKFDTYHLVDFPEVNGLSKKYLNNFKQLKNKIQHISTSGVSEINNLDLVISNYAFSECSREYQELYYNSFIKKAKNFYIVYNNFTENNLNSQAFIQLASKDFYITFETEIRPPHTVHIIYGKNAN